MFLRFLGAIEELEEQQCLPAVHIIVTRDVPFLSISHITLYVNASETKLDLHHGKCITKENLLLREPTVYIDSPGHRSPKNDSAKLLLLFVTFQWLQDTPN